MKVVEASGLGKRYGGSWALRECTLAVPAGHVAALVGPNGAGKTTLLNLAVGLSAPTAGNVTVLDGRPAGSPAALDGIAFVAQDTPLYRNLTVADMIYVARSLNRRFDQPYARARLDEPVAMLDPVARHDFMATVLAAAAADGVSVLLSSHVLAELERVADYLILLARGQVRLAGEVDDLPSQAWPCCWAWRRCTSGSPANRCTTPGPLRSDVTRQALLPARGRSARSITWRTSYPSAARCSWCPR